MCQKSMNKIVSVRRLDNLVYVHFEDGGVAVINIDKERLENMYLCRYEEFADIHYVCVPESILRDKEDCEYVGTICYEYTMNI